MRRRPASLGARKNGHGAPDLAGRAADGLILVDAAGRIRFVNPAAAALLGRAPGALLGARCEFPLDGTARREWAVPGYRPGERVVEIQVADATWKGRRARLASLRDVTERKQLEQRKDELLSKVAHELRTPLTSIRGSVTLLLSRALGALTDEQRDFLDTISQDLDRLVRLLNNVLDLSQLESGHMVLGRHPVDLAELVEEVCRSLQAMVEHRRIVRELSPAPPVYGDRHLLVQVLINLLANAVKFTAENGTITFRLRPEGDAVALSVIDNGVGISPEALGTLFQRYRQDAAGSGSRPRGTGLGLSICREIMDLHEGQLCVASEVGQGSVFTLRLPRYDPAQALQRLFDDLAAARAADQPGRTVLVVDLQGLAPIGDAAGRPLRQLRDACEQLIRRSIARADHLLTMEPALLIVLAKADQAGAQAMLQRLRGVCAGWAEQALGAGAAGAIRFATATSPQDGADAARLLEAARARCHA